MAESAALLVDEVFPEQPVRQWVLSVPYPLRFLFASRPDIMGAVLGIVYRVIATHLIRKAGFSAKRARTGAVTLIQRFGSALNLNLHFHMLFLDRVYVERPDGSLTFGWVKAPTGAELSALAQHIAERVGRFLERQGLLERDAESTCLAELALDGELMEALLADSISYRIAVGPRAGRKVFTLQSLPSGDEGSGAVRCARAIDAARDDRCADEGRWRLEGDTLCWDLQRFGSDSGVKLACVRVEAAGAGQYTTIRVGGFGTPFFTFTVPGER